MRPLRAGVSASSTTGSCWPAARSRHEQHLEAAARRRRLVRDLADPRHRPLRRTGIGAAVPVPDHGLLPRSEEHTSELQSLMRISYAVFCLKKKNIQYIHNHTLN